MRWKIEYFEQEDTTQPAEVFEDLLDANHVQLSSKLARIAVELQTYGFRLGGGYIEKCQANEGMWEIRAIHSGLLAREFFGFDEERIVLLHGYIKRVGQPASERDLKKAYEYLTEYIKTRHISPVQKEKDNE